VYWSLCRALWSWHSAKKPLCRVPPSALGKLTKGPAGSPFAECRPVYTRQTSLPSVLGDTRQRRRLRYKPSWWRLFFTEYRVTLGKDFTECPIKSTRLKSRCRCTVRRALFAEYHTRLTLCWVLQGPIPVALLFNALRNQIWSKEDCKNLLSIFHHPYIACPI
jgi:hypothetical protein